MQLHALEISKTYHNNPVLSQLNCTVHPGKCTAVTGPNGSGKTTLLRIFCGLTRPQKGKVHLVDGQRTYTPWEKRHLFGLASPEMQFYPELTALENLQFFNTMRGGKTTTDDLLLLLNRFQLHPNAYHPAGTFSTGMKQKLRLALALAHAPFFLLLDEPTSNLDESGRHIIASVITAHLEKGTVILATNDLQEAKDFGDEFIRLDQTHMRTAG